MNEDFKVRRQPNEDFKAAREVRRQPNEGLYPNEDFRVWAPRERMPELCRFRTDIPVVIFVDGWGLTSDHKHYHMIPSDGVPTQISKAAENMVHSIGTEAVVYTATDEVSFIFSHPADLLQYFQYREETYEDYICSLFAETFLRLTSKNLPNVRFSLSLFYVKKEDIGMYIENRREVCHHTSMQYVAKEYLPSKMYHGLETDALRELLKENGLWEPLISNHPLYDGIEKHYREKKNQKNSPTKPQATLDPLCVLQTDILSS